MTVMFDSTFVGTLASVPSADRSHPGLLVEAGGHRVMVDCGEGTQRSCSGAAPASAGCFACC
jgi:ribonuclease Z